MFNLIPEKSVRTGNGHGIAVGILAVLITAAVSTSLLFQLGSSDNGFQKKYSVAKYKASSDIELNKKIASLGTVQMKGLATLTNLDMPDLDRVKSTIEKVDLFDTVFTKQELCLTQAVYFEARGEPLIGQVAIAEVVLNRVFDSKYPNDACEVVFQNQHKKNRCQFSFACDGKPDRPKDLAAWERALKIVALVMAGERSGVARSATHYHASYVSPYWRTHLRKVGEVGRHIFYKVNTI
ncbi:MAG: cell wall hydrolase [Sneathiella sp.]|nr:cell wall hydrolase [Sneathiella sp.]